ncbi:MAG: hypothetical protein K2X64_09105, partial [Rhodocyclaceae bacterium]|nr:hypothetical protein [Rhodocyclaceae bacterium]
AIPFGFLALIKSADRFAITVQRQRDERTLYLASHDDLTGLANRWRSNEELEVSFARRSAMRAEHSRGWCLI